MRRLLLSFLLLLCPAHLLGQAQQVPAPYARSAECGVLLPCIPPTPNGLAGHLRMALLADHPDPDAGVPFSIGGWLSVGASFWRWGEAGAWLAGRVQPAASKEEETQWRLGPIGVWGMLSPPFLRHLGDPNGEQGLSLGAHVELATGRAPFDDGGRLFDAVQTYTLITSWQQWRLFGMLVAGAQLGDQDRARCQAGCPSYRGGFVGTSIWARLTRHVHLGADGMLRASGEGLNDAVVGIGVRLLEGDGVGGSIAGVWRADLQKRQGSWQYIVIFGVTYGPGYDSGWLAAPPELPPPELPAPYPGAPPLGLGVPPLDALPPGPSCLVDPTGREPPLFLPSLSPAPEDPQVTVRSWQACQVAGYRQLQGRGWRPLPGWRNTRWPPRWGGRPGARGPWPPGGHVPPWWWTTPRPPYTSIGPPQGDTGRPDQPQPPPRAEPPKPPPPPPLAEPEQRTEQKVERPRGSRHPNTASTSKQGTWVHQDKPGRLPDQLREDLPETQLEFAKQGEKGPDVRVVGGKHPSEYPGSTWPPGVMYGDFKPDTPGGRKTFRHDQRTKWPEPVHMIPYDPVTGRLRR